MNSLVFLKNLRKEGKLHLVNPSEEIKNSYLKKSESFLSSAGLLLKNNYLEEAVIILYYSMYYSLTALLYGAGIKCENHSASIILLRRLFDLKNREIWLAKKERINKQYYVDFKINKEQAKDLMKKAEEFNSELLDFIANLNNEEINNYRKKFISILD